MAAVCGRAARGPLCRLIWSDPTSRRESLDVRGLESEVAVAVAYQRRVFARRPSWSDNGIAQDPGQGNYLDHQRRSGQGEGTGEPLDFSIVLLPEPIEVVCQASMHLGAVVANRIQPLVETRT